MKKPLLFLGALLLAVLLFFYVRSIQASTSVPVVRITIYNPYSFSVKLQVKCDWNRRLYSHEYKTKIVVPGQGKKTVSLPSDRKNCEIWPHVKFF